MIKICMRLLPVILQVYIMYALVGLLTCSFIAPSQHYCQWQKSAINFSLNAKIELTATGIVLDSHQIPFSLICPNEQTERLMQWQR